MYKLCHTEQSARRQREMEQALLNMMLQKRYEDISIGDLCDSLQIPRRAFYRYFSGKEGALYALIDHTLADFFQIPTEKRTNATDELTQTFRYWKENKQLLDALAYSNLSGILSQRSLVFSLQEGYMPRRFKRFPPEQQALAMSFAVSGLAAMILTWHSQGFLLSADELSALAVTLLKNPLMP